MGTNIGENTTYDKCVQGEINLSEVFLCIDEACSFHGDMRSHADGAMSMGYVIIYKNLLKHKININISTKIELVEFSEYIPHNLCLMMFLV